MAMAGRKRARCRPSLYRPSGTMLEVATSDTPFLNNSSIRVPRIIASVMSDTKNSSKQMTLASSLKRLAMMVSGFFSPLRVFISSCTRFMKRWKCVRIFCLNGSASKKVSTR
ncbi:hypothetical protein D3C72_1552390 [compost metagenome]